MVWKKTVEALLSCQMELAGIALEALPVCRDKAVNLHYEMLDCVHAATQRALEQRPNAKTAPTGETRKVKIE